MHSLSLNKGSFPNEYLQKTVQFILSIQQSDGCIPWFQEGKADPWDHTEAAMALSIAGEFSAAEKAYGWLQQQQLDDGSWYANYQDGSPIYCDKRETNFVAYVATGVWHHYLISSDIDFLKQSLPMVEKAVEFVLQQQSASGEIYWAVDEEGMPLKDALITGCCSIYKSLECAINIAASLAVNKPDWRLAYYRLGYTLRHQPECFDRTWQSKERFSMDWFYPILAGIYAGADARARINKRWDQFVKKDLGCLCVSDQPWVTIAESCELTMALLAAGERAKAVMLFSWLHQWRDDKDGAYWTGYQFKNKVIWPREKTTWTAAAVILATDAITGHTPAAKLFLTNNLLAEINTDTGAQEAIA